MMRRLHTNPGADCLQRPDARQIVLIWVCVLCLICTIAGSAGSEEVVSNGLRISFSIEPGEKGRVRAGEQARLSFSIVDAETGAPVSALTPAVWLDQAGRDLAGFDGKRLDCAARVKLFVKGSLAVRPDVDLNSYFIFALNDDASISVIDPIVGVTGRTQLYRMILLRQPAEDWAEDLTGRRLYVTMPKAGEVAAIDLDALQVVGNVAAGENPRSIALQPDGRYLWVTNEPASANPGGVTVIDPEKGIRAAVVETGAGSHEVAFSRDSLSAFVSNSTDGTISVVDTQTLKKVRDIRIGKGILSLAMSRLSGAMYAAVPDEGRVVVVDDRSYDVAAQIRLKPGIESLRVSPDGRWVFALNPREDQVVIVDASDNSIVHTMGSIPTPDRVAFSGSFAYVTSKKSAEIRLIQLSEIGKGETPAGTRIYAGQKPPSASPHRALAHPVFPTDERGVTLIANPADGYVYYYMEGMEVPMGSFKGYGRIPKAVRTSNRSIRETGKGTYSATVRLPSSGVYEAAFLLDSPRVLHCFPFEVDGGSLAANDVRHEAEIEILTTERTVISGEKIRVRFRVRGGAQPAEGARDFLALLMKVPGTWQERMTPRPVGPGIFEAEMTLPEPGIYHLFLGSRSMGLPMNRKSYAVLHAKAADSTDRSGVKK